MSATHATVLGKLGRGFRRIGLAVVMGMSLTGCDNDHGMMMGTRPVPMLFKSNGERIYFTGVSESGAPIAYTGGSIHLQMMGGSCATCHGSDRRGGRMMPEFWVVAPPLTRSALFKEHDEGDAHGEHVNYDAESLRRAVFQGIDPVGSELDPIMPRWSMSDEDWRDLMTFLSQ